MKMRVGEILARYEGILKQIVAERFRGSLAAYVVTSIRQRIEGWNVLTRLEDVRERCCNAGV